MRFILILLLIIGLILAGLTVMDYFGYYINWNKSILSLTVLVPVIKAIQTFFTNPVKEFDSVKEKISKD
jgi:hypothetical protein